MRNEFYNTGERPRVGDTVRVATNNDLSYRSNFRYAGSKVFKVVDVVRGVRSTLIKIDGYNAAKAASFNLINRGSGVVNEEGKTELVDAKQPEYAVFHNNDFKFLAYDYEDLHRRVIKLLEKKPLEEYKVYNLEWTAKANPIVIDWSTPNKEENDAVASQE